MSDEIRPASETICRCGAPLGYSWTWCTPCQYELSKRLEGYRATIAAKDAEIERLNEWIAERQLPAETDRYEAELSTARAQIAALREALETARCAIAAAPDETWGTTDDGVDQWPVSKEILSKLDDVLAASATRADAGARR